MNWFASKNNFRTFHDWYSVSVFEINQAAGDHSLKNFKFYFLGPALLFQFSNSPYSLLRDTYPEFCWLPWEFRKAPKVNEFYHQTLTYCSDFGRETRVLFANF